MELQNIYLSIIFTLLPDYLLHLFRMIGIMSSPIHEHYRCAAPTRRSQTTTASSSSVQDSEITMSRMMDKSSSEEGSGSGSVLNNLQPEPLVAAMYSLQFVADVVNRVQSALNQCSTSNCQMPTNSAMTSIEFARSTEPSFCYFFIDMHPQYDTFDTCHDPDETDLKNMSDQQCASTGKTLAKNISCKLARQRSISECSDDSFICFEDDTDLKDTSDHQSQGMGTTAAKNTPCKITRQRSMSECSDDSFICFEDDSNLPDDCINFDDQADFNSTDNTDDCKFDSQEQDADQEFTKKVRFNLKPKVHVMHTWDFAYRAARKGAWQEIARDRDRFQQRIKRLAPTIDIVLNSNHREKVYRDRFLDVN
ncbi:uncharacterized protein LOC132793836 [Drosophila nasuta]|uniref:Uncharacterized protein LOC117567907 n=1 Tax=Drosophila albomicans TaxID=7291 RepID=A0A6P8Y654_DROAB|nr:uncharacterized protein LOC117567907 [Drosophila albomicans]XP_034104077.1 uncharacterized protein LOC117567907 [Drosophila albomicans]XP_060659924.1 uncharacterized protein LOC132793836 [Drosophila nasuta]XP_060659925.1 uncharacterized protein LOC132793836 [Drosophila nasuta]